MKDFTITESEARLIICSECDDVIRKAKAKAGEMIERIVLSNDGDPVKVFDNCMNVVTAFMMQMSAWKNN